MIGETILHYKILEKLGEGGMGEVFKAQDTKLDRFVALKFLPSQLTASEEVKTRFIQEAKAASAMNHPNICTIYSIEEYNNQLFISMEFVEGKTLKDKKDSLSKKQILEVGIQVAEGLAAAHEKGIVHRDIKPENIMVRKDGIVQIMDFGLAKLYTSGNVSRLTKAGTAVGTMGYMSPEQVQGLDVDHRTDIFSLGVVLYEMLTGESPFKGIHETAIMYEIVNVDPVPISTIKEGIDPELDGIILECLEKDKDERCQSTKELAKDLRKVKKSTGHRKSRIYQVNTGTLSTVSGSSTIVTPSGYLRPGKTNRTNNRIMLFILRKFFWIISLLLLIALVIVVLILNRPDSEKIVTRFSLDIGDTQVLDLSAYPAIAISHDGKSIVYKANSNFYIRKMNSLQSQLIPGLENASSPFFSPDDNWIGFFKEGKLEKISLSGGTPVVLADATDNRGGTWNNNGSIVFTAITTVGLSMVSENGGPVKTVTTPDTIKAERTHRWPSFLPDGKHVLFTVGLISSPDYYENATIDIVNIETGERKKLIKDASTARYINTGHILFSRSGILYIVPFDIDDLEITGQPFPVLEGVYSELTTGITNYMVSENGTLIYIPGAIEGESRRIVKISTNGETTVIDSVGHAYIEPQLSPDDKKIAIVIRMEKDFDIYVFDIQKKTLSRLTFGGINRTPHWSPDGKYIAYMKRFRDKTKSSIVTKPSDGSGEETEIYTGDGRLYLDEWSKNGDYLIVDNLTLSSQSDLLVIPLKEGKKPWKFLNTPKDEYEASVSPDGKWISYLANEFNTYQIYVRSFPDKAGKWQISSDLAEEPRWSPDGKYLYYRKGSQLIEVPISYSPSFSPGLQKVLISGFPSMNVDSGISYDISSDGKYFITTTPLGGSSVKKINVVSNWTEEIINLTNRN
jgi:serine/threonine protein kinase/Tol biopolymer transport system component